MTPARRSFFTLAACVVAGTALFLVWRHFYDAGDALVATLRQHAAAPGRGADFIASLIANYEDTRADATRWSGVFWGFSFAGLAASASAGLVLKMETLAIGEPRRKDLAAFLAFVAALLIVVSTTGDFQRKWQANRLAAAKLERLGYDFVGDAAPDVGAYFRAIGEIQYERSTQIAGKPAEVRPPARPASVASR